MLTNPQILNFKSKIVDTTEITKCTPISSAPILFYSSRELPSAMIQPNADTHIIPSLQSTYNAVGKQWLCINAVVGSFTTWSRSGDSGSIEWEVMHIFVSDVSASLFALIYPSMKYTITQALVQTITSLMATDI